MKNRLAAAIAWRYLFAKKSHSAVTAISVVAMCGVAVATAAIVCVLSVFNGFADLLSDKHEQLLPDIMVAPREGKVFAASDSLAAEIAAIPGVAEAMPSLTDGALAIYEGRETPILLKGVRRDPYSRITRIRRIIASGTPWSLTAPLPEGEASPVYDSDLEEFVESTDTCRYLAALSIGAATKLGSPAIEEPLLLFAPRREGKVNLANPAMSFLRENVEVSSVWQTGQSDFDDNMVLVDISLARRILQYTDEASAIEVALQPGADKATAIRAIEKVVGPAFTVKDRARQQEVNFRMVSIEKWVTFLLLTFILLIASFNIISSLSMLIIDKEEQLRLMHALGSTRGGIGRIFCWESFFVTLLGALVGMAVGVALCLLQQHFGIIKLNGNEDTLLVKAYPVSVVWSDLLVAFVPILLTGALTAAISTSFAKSKLKVAR